MSVKVAICRCPDYSLENVSQSIGNLLKLLGGIEEFIKPRTKVFIKPNLLSATFPESGVTTHPEIVKEVIRRVKERGVRVFMGDSPGGALNLDEVYKKTGMKKIAKELDVELVKFEHIENVRGYPVAKIVLECDYFISLPKFKTHALTLITGAIKNSFGLIPGLFKTELHLRFPHPKDFSKVLVDVFSIRPPDLIIVDGVVSMAGEGPAGGILKNTGLVLGGRDGVAIDAVLGEIIGVGRFRVHTTVEGFERGLGEMDFKKIEILGLPLEEIKIGEFPLPSYNLFNAFPRFLLKIGGKFFKTYPVINNRKCKRCGVCVKSCPKEAIRIRERFLKIDYQICIKCLCCYEFCPHNSVYLKRNILMRLLGRDV